MQSTATESKSYIPSLTTGKVTPVALETLQPLISSCFKGPEAVFTADEFGAIYERNPRTVYHYATGQVRLSLDQFVTLVKESARRGKFDLLDVMIPEGFTLMPQDTTAINGDCDDELGELTEDAGKMRESFKKGKFSTAKLFLFKMKRDAAKVEREIEAKL